MSSSQDPSKDLEEEKSHSFRKRRLSLPKHSSVTNDQNDDDYEQHAAVDQDASPPLELSPRLGTFPDASEVTTGSHAEDDDDDEEFSPDPSEKAQSFRKRRLSLPNLLALANAAAANGDETDDAPPAKRSRRDSAASVATSASGRSGDQLLGQSPPVFPSKTLHASELLNQFHNGGPPPSPAVHANSILYELQPLPPQTMLPETSAATEQSHSASSKTLLAEPKWKRRMTVQSKHEEHKLPFPRDIVGTYSCHGVEPYYGEYAAGDDDDDDDGVWDDDDEDESPQKPASMSIDKSPTGLAIQTSTDGVTSPQVKRAAIAAKINQDRGGIAFPYGNCPRTALFAVYDGHGHGGELVSQYVLHEMQRRLERHVSFPNDLEKAFIDTFHAIDEGLKKEPLIEPVYAGTTACVALLKESKLTLANVGDSRAVVARNRSGPVNPTRQSSAWEAVALTVDQNPDLPEELDRILNAGGFVTEAPAPGLSARVWLDAGCTQIGLAMARSLGDHAVSEIGVIATPVVTTYDVDDKDEFLVLASDGVWEFLSSQDAVDIVGANLDRGATKACQALIEAAAAKWHEEEGEYRDDITAIVVCLQKVWQDSPDPS